MRRPYPLDKDPNVVWPLANTVQQPFSDWPLDYIFARFESSEHVLNHTHMLGFFVLEFLQNLSHETHGTTCGVFCVEITSLRLLFERFMKDLIDCHAVLMRYHTYPPIPFLSERYASAVRIIRIACMGSLAHISYLTDASNFENS